LIKDLLPGDPAVAGPYRLLGRLGQGGMGQVYLGRSPGGRRVAVKVIRPDLADDPEFRLRFAREVAAARGVNGMFTALVLDADTEGQLPWMATAYVPGPSLAEAVASQGPLPAGTLLSLAAGLAEGLQAIHQAGIVHRDLKPSNVLLAADGPRVIDFGISRAREAAPLTQTGIIIGTPGFFSPEQAAGRVVGPPSDIFSLGGVLTYAATGAGPFGTGPAELLVYRVRELKPELSNVPAELRPIVERCLMKDPAVRPAPADLLAELDRLGVHSGGGTPEWLPAPLADSVRRYTPAGESATISAIIPAAIPAAVEERAARRRDAGPRAWVRGRRRLILTGGVALMLATGVGLGVALPGSGPGKVLGKPAARVDATTTATARLSPSMAATQGTASRPAARVSHPASATHSATHTEWAGNVPYPGGTIPRAIISPIATGPPPRIGAVSGAKSLGCVTGSPAASVAGGAAVSFRFANDSAVSVAIYYLAPNGASQLLSSLDPGQHYTTPAAVGQDWMVGTTDGACVGVFELKRAGWITVS
jgi:hypothetical protein